MSKNLSAKYYQNIRKDYKKAHERHQNLSKEEKKQQYGCEYYKNLLKDEKSKLFGYRKKYYRIRKNA